MSQISASDLKVRSQPLSALNRRINAAFAGQSRFGWVRLIRHVFHLQLPRESAAKKLRLPHPYGVIITGGAQLGLNNTIYQGVTIGHQHFGPREGAPILGDDVIVFPNAVVVGAIEVGAGAIIGAGAVVVRDVPPGAIVAGNPAKIVGQVVADRK